MLSSKKSQDKNVEENKEQNINSLKKNILGGMLSSK